MPFMDIAYHGWIIMHQSLYIVVTWYPLLLLLQFLAVQEGASYTIHQLP